MHVIKKLNEELTNQFHHVSCGCLEGCPEKDLVDLSCSLARDSLIINWTDVDNREGDCFLGMHLPF